MGKAVNVNIFTFMVCPQGLFFPVPLRIEASVHKFIWLLNKGYSLLSFCYHISVSGVSCFYLYAAIVRSNNILSKLIKLDTRFNEIYKLEADHHGACYG